MKTQHLPLCYISMYGRMALRAVELGYSLALHGSMVRDCDMIAVPWTDTAVSAEELATALIETSGGFLAPHEVDIMPVKKPHGRLCWSIHLGGGPYIDLAVMPRTTL